jgi:hypothetical protein
MQVEPSSAATPPSAEAAAEEADDEYEGPQEEELQDVEDTLEKEEHANPEDAVAELDDLKKGTSPFPRAQTSSLHLC